MDDCPPRVRAGSLDRLYRLNTILWRYNCASIKHIYNTDVEWPLIKQSKADIQYLGKQKLGVYSFFETLGSDVNLPLNNRI
jgi:hypothetical protein